MIRGFESIIISSENPQKLSNFYQDIVGLRIKEEYQSDEGEVSFEMEVGEGSAIYINSHSEVKGKAQEPLRVLINLEVDDAEKEADRLKEAGVDQIEPLYHIEGYGLISTFADPDGNYFQVVQVRPVE